MKSTTTPLDVQVEATQPPKKRKKKRKGRHHHPKTTPLHHCINLLGSGNKSEEAIQGVSFRI
jgi:hypothetical protein